MNENVKELLQSIRVEDAFEYERDNCIYEMLDSGQHVELIKKATGFYVYPMRNIGEYFDSIGITDVAEIIMELQSAECMGNDYFYADDDGRIHVFDSIFETEIDFHNLEFHLTRLTLECISGKPGLYFESLGDASDAIKTRAEYFLSSVKRKAISAYAKSSRVEADCDFADNILALADDKTYYDYLREIY